MRTVHLAALAGAAFLVAVWLLARRARALKGGEDWDRLSRIMKGSGRYIWTYPQTAGILIGVGALMPWPLLLAVRAGFALADLEWGIYFFLPLSGVALAVSGVVALLGQLAVLAFAAGRLRGEKTTIREALSAARKRAPVLARIGSMMLDRRDGEPWDPCIIPALVVGRGELRQALGAAESFAARYPKQAARLYADHAALARLAIALALISLPFSIGLLSLPALSFMGYQLQPLPSFALAPYALLVLAWTPLLAGFVFLLAFGAACAALEALAAYMYLEGGSSVRELVAARFDIEDLFADPPPPEPTPAPAPAAQANPTPLPHAPGGLPRTEGMSAPGPAAISPPRPAEPPRELPAPQTAGVSQAGEPSRKEFRIHGLEWFEKSSQAPLAGDSDFDDSPGLNPAWLLFRVVALAAAWGLVLYLSASFDGRHVIARYWALSTGRVADAQVEDVSDSYGGHVVLRVRYEVERGVFYVVDCPAGASAARVVRPGQKVKVRFLRENPRAAFLLDDFGFGRQRVLLLVLLISLVGGALHLLVFRI